MKKLVLVVLLLVFVGVAAVVSFPIVHTGNSLRAQFDAFKEKFSKSYATPEEHDRRFLIFIDNLRYIKELNNKNDGATYGVTQFADLTKEEFKAKFLMNNPGPLGPKEPFSSFNG